MSHLIQLWFNGLGILSLIQLQYLLYFFCFVLAVGPLVSARLY